MYDVTMTVISFCSLIVMVVMLIMIEKIAQKKLLFGKKYYYFPILCLAIWIFFKFLEQSTSDIDCKILLIRLQYITITFFPICLWTLTKRFVFNRDYSIVEIIGITISATVLSYLIIYNPGNLLYSSYHLLVNDQWQRIVIEFEYLFYILFAVFVFLCAIMNILLVVRMIRVRDNKLKITMLIFSIVIPVIAFGIYYFSVEIVDLTVLAFVLTGICIFISFAFYGHFDAYAYVQRYVFELQKDFILVINEYNNITYVNKMVFTLVNKSFNWCIGQDISSIFPGYDSMTNYIYKTAGKKGEIIEVSFQQVEIPQTIGNKKMRLVVGHNVTDINKTNQQLDYLMTHDRLTGLINRSVLADILKKYQQRTNSGLTGTVLYGVGVINDNILLSITSIEERHKIETEIANHLRKITTPSHTIAAYGENRYLIFTNGLAQNLEYLFKSLSDIPSMEVFIANRKIVLKFCVGLYVIESGVSVDDAISSALYALNLALQSAGEKLKVYDKNAKLSHGIHRYISDAGGQLNYDRHFELTYQPIIDTKEKRVAGAQVFVKWNNPALGRLATETFMPVFEQTGDVVELEMYILQKICDDLKLWGDTIPEDFFFSVNISKRQFQNPIFLQRLSQIISEGKIKPQHLNLKLKNGLSEFRMETLTDFVAELHNIGVLVTIDDYGSVSSSISHIIKLKCDMIAVHSDITYNAHVDRDDDLIIRTICNVSSQLDIKLIVQHVESISNLKAFENMGVRYVQGYVFSHALVGNDFIEYLLHFHEKF